MTRIVRRMVPSLLLLTILFVGCSRPGSVFLGKWVNTTNPNDTMEITRNGEQFLILAGRDKVGASFKDGSLQVQSMMGTMTLTYIKRSDTMVGPGFFGLSEYKRAK